MWLNSPETEINDFYVAGLSGWQSVLSGHFFFHNFISLCFAGLHEEFAPEGAQANAHRGEAVQLLVAGVRLEVCQVGRAHQASEETHGQQTFQMSPL